MSTSFTNLLTLSLDIYFPSCMPASMLDRASIPKSRLLAMPGLSAIVAASTGRPTGLFVCSCCVRMVVLAFLGYVCFQECGV
jgi:hypothetical protein